MRFLIMLIIICPLFLDGQVVNGGFDQWEMKYGTLLPSHYIINSDIQKSTIERELGDDMHKNIMKVNPKEKGTCSSNISQVVDITNLSPMEKGSVCVVIKIYSPSGKPHLRLGLETYLADTTFLSYNGERIVDWNTNGYEEIKIDDINPEADLVYFWIAPTGHYENNEYVCRTTVWVDEVYIKPKKKDEIVLEIVPEIVKSSSGYRIEGINHDEFSYSLYAIDGKYIKGGNLTIDDIKVEINGVYVLNLLNTISKKNYSYKLVYVE